MTARSRRTSPMSCGPGTTWSCAGRSAATRRLLRLGARGRRPAALLAQVAWPTAATPLVYVCGPTNFVEAVSQALVQGGYPPQRVKTERFGATGGT